MIVGVAFSMFEGVTMPSRYCVGAGALGLLLCAPILTTCVLLAGCGSQRRSEQREQSNLKPLVSLYVQCMGRGDPPANEEQFKKFIASLPESRLADLGVKDRESLFVSPRDHKPYGIVYGPAAKSGPPGPGGQPVIVYEQEGVGGKRWVASALGAIDEVNESQFHQLVPGAP